MKNGMVSISLLRRNTHNLLLLALLILFFCSGMSGLIYQVLWLRLLSQIFGVTIPAATAVLASFMGGLALGSFVAGRFVDRTRSPLFWFGVVEILVGVSAFSTQFLLDAVENAYVGLYPKVGSALTLLTAVRFLLSSLVLVVPTTLMGSTLPIVIKSSLIKREGLGQRIGLLYGINTAGAIAGTMLTGFYLIGGIGIAASFRLAASINLSVGLIALLLSILSRRKSDNPLQPVNQPVSIDATNTSPALRWTVLWVFALSGFVSLALEVVWFRVLALFLQVTTYAFTVMLATVLLGIAAGSCIIAPLMRRRLSWAIVLAGIEMLLGVACLLSLKLLGSAYDLGPVAESLISGAPQAEDFALMIAASFLAIFPATLLMGAAFPIGLHIWTAPDGDINDTGRRVGVFYSTNVIGAVLGAIIAGFVLVPILGSRKAIILLAVLTFLSGMLLAVISPSRRSIRSAVAFVSAVAFIAAVIKMPDPFSIALKHRFPGQQPLWWEEGTQTTVGVLTVSEEHRALYLDGLSQASDKPHEVRIHQQIGHLPMLLHPEPKDALVIGLGGGVTAGAVSQHSGVKVDVIELSETVARGARWFSHVNNNILNQPNARLHIGDGRNYLLLTDKKYDVITADIIRPFHAGAGNLYSVEYFQLARKALKEDGLMLQWLNRRSEIQYKMIMRTFLSVFPDSTLWVNGSLLIGSKQRFTPDRAAFERRMQDPNMQKMLETLDISDFDSLMALYTAGPEELFEFAGNSHILTDDRPLTEYYLSLPDQMKKKKGMFQKQSDKLIERQIE